MFRVVDTHKKRLPEALLMSTPRRTFSGRNDKKKKKKKNKYILALTSII